MINDTKLRLATRRGELKHYETVVTFHALLERCSIKETDELFLCNDLYEEIEIQTDISMESIKKVIIQLEKVGIIENGKIKNWSKYQANTSTERVRKHRAAKKEIGGNVTPLHETQRRVEESREEKNRGEASIKNPNIKTSTSGDGAKKNYNIQIHLKEEALQKAKSYAPGYDIYQLAKEYNTAVNDGTLKAPKDPDKAFPAWCKTIYEHREKVPQSA